MKGRTYINGHLLQTIIVALVLVVLVVFVYLQNTQVSASNSKTGENEVDNSVIDTTQMFPNLFGNESWELKQIPRRIQATKIEGLNFVKKNPFSNQTKLVSQEEGFQEVLSEGTILTLNKSELKDILQKKYEVITLEIPNGKGGLIELDLIKSEIFAPNFSVKTSAPVNEKLDSGLGIHYQGVIRGNDFSLVAISIFPTEIMGFFSDSQTGNNVIGRLQNKNNIQNQHIIYAEKDLKIKNDFICDTKDSEKTDTKIELPKTIFQQPESPAARCVKLYLEANFDLYQNKGSIANTTSYLTGLFNQSATLFSNDGIPITISEILVWTSPSPYTGTTSDDVLNQFRATRTNFNGNLAHLITLDRNFGGIAYVDTLCNTSSRYGVSDIDATYLNVPTYSWSAYVLTHEVGHNLGSPHTHACSWNGNNTAIDGCGVPEGSCSRPPNPLNGGTIMSYCHQQSVGINFQFGFGSQPKNLILSRFNNATCVTDCGSALPPPTLVAPGTSSTPGSSISTLTPTFQWTSVPGADGYGLYISKFNGSGYDLVFNSQTFIGQPISGNTYTLPSGILQNGSQYRWNMGSHNSSGYGSENVFRNYFSVSISGCPSPSAIAFGQTINGSLQSGDCVDTDGSYYDRYTFSGTAGQQIYIAMDSTQFNAYLYLYQGIHPGGTLLDTNNNGGGGTNARIPATSGFRSLPATGTYTILANSNLAGETGSYSLTLGTNSVGSIPVIVQTNPAGRSYSVDGTTYTSSLTFNWIVGESHSIGTVPVDNNTPGTRYLWSNWSDGEAISHFVSPTSATTYTANFATEYQLTTNSVPQITPSFSFWWSSGQNGFLLAEAPAGYAFSSWTGSGNGSYSGTTNPASITMNGPITQTANYTPISGNVSVTVQTSPAGRSFTVDGTSYSSTQTFSWINGESHIIATASPQNATPGTRYSWNNWSDGGPVSHTVTPASATTYTANFTTEYQLTTNSMPQITPTFSFWWGSGQSTSLLAQAPLGYIFSGWTGTGNGSYSGTNNPAHITMNGPITQTANFIPLTPTAANATISGRVTRANGRAISNATLVIQGGNLSERKFVRTNAFGYYRFQNLEVGQTYIMNVASKRYSFANPTRVITLNEDLTGEDFVSDRK